MIGVSEPIRDDPEKNLGEQQESLGASTSISGPRWNE